MINRIQSVIVRTLCGNRHLVAERDARRLATAYERLADSFKAHVDLAERALAREWARADDGKSAMNANIEARLANALAAQEAAEQDARELRAEVARLRGRVVAPEAERGAMLTEEQRDAVDRWMAIDPSHRTDAIASLQGGFAPGRAQACRVLYLLQRGPHQ